MTTATPNNVILHDITQKLLADWQIIKANIKAGAKEIWPVAWKFMLECVNQFIIAVEPLLENGDDKKAAVLVAAGIVYSSTIYPILPIFLKPFSAQIESFLLTIVISGLIDFTVEMYNKTLGAVPTAPLPATTTGK